MQGRLRKPSLFPRHGRLLRNLGALGAALALAIGARAGTPTGPAYHVTVNTQALSGTAGYFFLTFNKGNVLDSLDADVAITNFVLNGGTLGAATTDGAVTGDLGAGTLDIANTSAPNDLIQGLTLGQDFSFDAALSGPAFDPTQTSTFGSTFTVGLLDSNGNPTQTTDPDGVVLNVDVNPDAGIGGPTYPNVVLQPVPISAAGPNSATSAVLIPQSPPGSPVVPEPGSVGLLIAGGLLGLVGSRRRFGRVGF